ncbi:MAG: ATP-binding cassette domain-containing protein [Pseudomonadota bacterium]
MSRLIEMHDISVMLGQKTVLFDINLHIDRGEIVTLVGPNGSGKTTLLRALIGAEKLSSGRIEKSKKLKIGYVPQKLFIDQSLPLTVQRFMSLPQSVSKSAAKAALEKTSADHLLDRQMRDLSGGQFQRVLLARALLGAPDLLLLDEATQGLDQQGGAQFYHLIAALQKELNCAILLVSHELHVVMAASDRVMCLNGHVCCEGTPAQVADAPEYRALFGTGTGGALALYRHEHDHSHDQDHSHAG